MNKIFFFRSIQPIQAPHRGFIVATLAGSFYAAIYAAAVAASCLELKDRLTGNLWDWTDWLCTVLGGIIAALMFYVLFPMVWN